MINRMLTISRWAKDNPKLSIAIIICCHLLVVITAIGIGTLLFILDYGTSKWLLPITANLFFIAFVFYPNISKEKKKNSASYLQQKAHDFTLVICYAVVIAFGLNNFLAQDNRTYNLTPQPTAKLIVHKLNSESQTANRKFSKSEVKGKFKKLKKQIKVEFRKLKKEFKSKSKNGKVFGIRILVIFAIIFAIILLVLLAYLIALLACHLSCSGAQGLAITVGIVGWLGVIWLGIIGIKNIFKIYQRKINNLKKTLSSN